MLSYITIGRNDNFGGNFNFRLKHSLDYNFNLLEKYEIPYEFIFVEWNPIPDKKLLSHKLLKHYKTKNIKCYICSNDIHNYYKNLAPTKVKFFEYHAKNVGIKRATQKFILSTNSDIFLSNEIVTKLANTKNPLSTDKIFRACRKDCDLEQLSENKQITEEYLASKVVKINHLSPPVFSNASGDFLLASTDLLHKLTGFDETITTTILHQDSRLLNNALSQNITICPLGDIYHFNHYNSFGFQGNAKIGLGNPSWGYQSNLPFHNNVWGLQSHFFKETMIEKGLFEIGIKNAT